MSLEISVRAKGFAYMSYATVLRVKLDRFEVRDIIYEAMDFSETSTTVNGSTYRN